MDPTIPIGNGFRRLATGRRGFTFVEMMAVITIIVILITIAIPIYQKSIIRSRAVGSLIALASSDVTTPG